MTSMAVATALLCAAAPAQTRPSSPSLRGPTTAAPTWTACPDSSSFECATVRAPLNYRHPEGRKIHLAVIRHRATGPKHRVGTLRFNPGGPGGSGTSDLPLMYPFFPEEIRERFDIVSWDPRGVGRSTAVRCFADAAQEIAWASQLPSGFPVGRKEREQWIRLQADLGRRCEQRDPVLLRHISTADSAHDLDVLRAALGERRLTYLGISYGTLLGATYANLFPDRVRAMVLDGNVNPRAWYGGNPKLPTFLRQGSDVGAARTLKRFLDLCGHAGPSRCAFSAGNPRATRAKYRALLRRLLAHPQGDMTYAATVDEVAQGLYTVHPAWTQLARELQDLWLGRTPRGSMRQDTPGGLLRTAPRGFFPPGAGDPPKHARAEEEYPGFEQQDAVLCAESPNPRDPRRYHALERFSARRAGALGRSWTWLSEVCSTWPARAAHRYTGPWDRSTTPILTLNTLYDPATPYRSGRAMTGQLGNARLLTVAGYGHTTLLNPSSCAAEHETAYLVSGVLPPRGTVCRQDAPPFTETASAARGRG